MYFVALGATVFTNFIHIDIFPLISILYKFPGIELQDFQDSLHTMQQHI